MLLIFYFCLLLFFSKEMKYEKIDPFNFIAAEYAMLPLIAPYLQPGNHRYTDGVNFASGGWCSS